MGYLSTIKTAFIIFPILAFLITVPYMLYHYHKYGAMPFLRVLIFYSFILYLLISYLLIILPLPSKSDVAALTTPRVQLIPFSFIVDIITKVDFKTNILTTPEVYQIIYNLLLTLPFGVYLRYYFKRSMKQTILYTFLLSLFFELTQLTGLYFIYPRSYRLFDVDDLMINTLGGLCGYLMTPLITFFLPTRDEIEYLSYEEGTRISVIKRISSFLLDLFFIMILYMILTLILDIVGLEIPNTSSIVITLIIYYVIIPSNNNGSTIGKKILNMHIVTLDDTKCTWDQYLIRYFILYAFLLGFPLLVISVVSILYKIISISYFLIVMCLLAFAFFILFIYILVNNIIKKKLFIYEKLSRTKNISTIKIPDSLKKEVKKL